MSQILNFSQIKVQDNFLIEEDFLKIQNLFYSNEFPWYYNSSAVGGKASGKQLSDFQFVHGFFKDDKKIGMQWIHSNYFDSLIPIIEKLNCRVLIRVKANLRPITHSPSKPDYHVDDENIKGTTSIFYINSNNGYTIFKETQKKVMSVENRLVSFPMETQHSGVTCTDQKVRIVINFNYIEG